MTEQHHDSQTDAKTCLVAYENHLDYVQSNIETKLPDAGYEGILGVLELGGSVGQDNHGFVDTSGSRLILIDIDKGRTGPMAEFLGDFNEKITPKGSVAAIDMRMLQKYPGRDGYHQGVMLLQPGDDPHILGRRAEGSRNAFGWDEQTAGGISSAHLDIRVGEDGVYVRDRDSSNGTVLATGEYAKDVIRDSPEHHEHVVRIKELLGAEAVEATVELINGNETAAHEKIAAILRSDVTPASVLVDKLRSIGNTPADIQKALAYESGNEELRQSIVSILGVRMRQLRNEGGHFHQRVQENADNNEVEVKEGPYKGKKLSSEDYVAVLALAKLDGSFRIEMNRNSGVAHDDQHAGQHRQAADTLLESFVEMKKAEHEAIVTENENVKTYVEAMRRRLDEINYPLQSATHLLDNIVVELRESYHDADSIRRAAGELFSRLDQCIDGLNDEMNHINILERQMDETPGISVQDIEKVAAIKQDIIVMRNGIDIVRQDEQVMTPLMRLLYEYDEMLVIQAQGYARNDSYQDVHNRLTNIASTMAGYIDS